MNTHLIGQVFRFQKGDYIVYGIVTHVEDHMVMLRSTTGKRLFTTVHGLELEVERDRALMQSYHLGGF